MFTIIGRLARAFTRYLSVIANFMLLPTIALGQQAPVAVATEADLSAKATGPTAALMSFQLDDWYTSSYQGVGDASMNQTVFRGAMPFSTWSLQHIFRITQPYVTSSTGDGHG